MKHVVLIGNCQCSGLRSVLSYTNFNEKYHVTQYANWQMIENNESPPIRDLSNADVIIYQPLSDVYGCFSTNPENPNNMMSMCKPDSIALSFPRIHNNSIWPIFKKHKHKDEYYGRELLSYYTSQHILTQDQFLYLYDNHILDFKMQDRFNYNMAITKQKEHNTDIKVHDYIIKNIDKTRLFLTQDHPTTTIFHHCVTQMLDTLDIDFSPSFALDSIDKNITGLEDSVYGHATHMYPDSSYSIFSYSDSMQNDSFYRTELQRFLDIHHIH
jgi:hypothetical protein